MWSGSSVPGRSTTSSGNNGRSGTKSPDRTVVARSPIVRHGSSHPRLDLARCGRYNASMELAGKVVVITGASMGIGEAIAKIFAREGASVVLLSRDAARAEAARTRIGF